jgi:hypothetical protein
MFGFMSKGGEYREIEGLPDEGCMSSKTSVMSSAEAGLPTHGHKDKLTAGRIGKLRRKYNSA